MKTWLKRVFYRIYYYRKKVSFHENVVLNIKNHFEGGNDIAPNCHIASSNIGFGTYISDNSIIKFCDIGRFCSLGSNIQTGLGVHPAHIFVSTHPAFFFNPKAGRFFFCGRR